VASVPADRDKLPGLFVGVLFIMQRGKGGRRGTGVGGGGVGEGGGRGWGKGATGARRTTHTATRKPQPCVIK